MTRRWVQMTLKGFHSWLMPCEDTRLIIARCLMLAPVLISFLDIAGDSGRTGLGETLKSVLDVVKHTELWRCNTVQVTYTWVTSSQETRIEPGEWSGSLQIHLLMSCEPLCLNPRMKMNIKCHDKGLGGSKDARCVWELVHKCFSAVSEYVSWLGQGRCFPGQSVL